MPLKANVLSITESSSANIYIYLASYIHIKDAKIGSVKKLQIKSA